MKEVDQLGAVELADMRIDDHWESLGWDNLLLDGVLKSAFELGYKKGVADCLSDYSKILKAAVPNLADPLQISERSGT